MATARSLDLIACDVAVWGCVKPKVAEQLVATVDELKQRIEERFATVAHGCIATVSPRTVRAFAMCCDKGGSHIDALMCKDVL